MSNVIVRIRLTDRTIESARVAAKTGEVVEFCDRHGAVYRGRVLEVEPFEIGVDGGWWVYFQFQDDFTTTDIVAKMLALREQGLKKPE